MDKLLKTFSDYGWEIKKGKEQVYGSVADIYAELNNEYGKYFFIIDDGNCYEDLEDALLMIYVNNIRGKIFEGRVGKILEFKTLMRLLSFKKI